LFSYIGTKGVESVGLRNVINVTMDSSANILEEIVGLMDFDKEALTGSVSKINAANRKDRW
jgi:hypothetical protein